MRLRKDAEMMKDMKGSKTVVRIIALEQGVIKVVGLRHD